MDKLQIIGLRSESLRQGPSAAGSPSRSRNMDDEDHGVNEDEDDCDDASDDCDGGDEYSW